MKSKNTTTATLHLALPIDVTVNDIHVIDPPWHNPTITPNTQFTVTLHFPPFTVRPRFEIHPKLVDPAFALESISRSMTMQFADEMMPVIHAEVLKQYKEWKKTCQ